MKRNNKSIFFIWMILGMAIIISQVGQPLIAQTQGSEQTASSDNGEEADQILAIGTDFAVTSTAGLHLNQEFYQIREILLDEVADPHVVHVAQKLTETDHFKTLFRKVISANAP